MSDGAKKTISVDFKITNKNFGAITDLAKAFGVAEKEAIKMQKGFNTAFRDLKKEFKSTQKAIKDFVTPIAAASTAAAALGVKFIQAASDMEETKSKVNEVFKGNSKAINDWSKTSIVKMGLAGQSALDTAALFGDMATGLGMNTEKAAQISTSLTQLSADLASFKNISQERAKVALNGVFTGETEALKSLGVVMTQANLEEFAHQKGIKKRIKDMKEAEKVMLRYNYVLSKTKNAHGDFERTGGGFANQMRKFTEMQKEISTKIGEVFLPKINSSLTRINKAISENMPQIVSAATPFFKTLANTIEFCTNHITAITRAIKIFGVAFLAIKGYQAAAATIKTIGYSWQLMSQVVNLCTQAYKANVLWSGLATFATKTFGGALNSLKFIGVIGVLTAVGAALYALEKRFHLGKKACDAFVRTFNKIKNHFQNNNKSETPTIPTANMPKYATGTTFATGGLSLVGENGPELVNLRRGSTVINNKETQKIIGSKDITININVAGNMIGNGEFINQIKQVLGKELKTALAV